MKTDAIIKILATALGLSWILTNDSVFVSAANYYNDDDGNNANNDDAKAMYYAKKYLYYGDDGEATYYKGKYQNNDDAAKAQYGKDYIKYWTSYAIQPKKCISYGNVDMVVFSIFEKSSNHCTDKPLGTYMTPVPTYVSAYIDQLESNAEDYGQDYEAPDQTFVNCYPQQTNSGNIYYVQLGCTDGTSTSFSYNVYKDNTCTTPNTLNGSDDIALSANNFQITWKQCLSCINFVDKNEDDADDQYFDNKMMNAPLCSTVWENKKTCDGKCARLGRSSESQWNSSDHVLLGVLTAFGAIMVFAIVKKRQNMSAKDTLLEEATMSAAGIQQTHVIGIFVLVLVALGVFVLLGLKSVTWVLLLLINVVLFGYLMKLTIANSLSSDANPDGADDSDDDDDDDDDDEEADYKAPNLPAIS